MDTSAPPTAANKATATACAAHPGAGAKRALRIGVFDSGVGGLSVLRALRARLPGAALLYVADSGYAPYGERSEAQVLARSEAISRFLRDQGADLLVVACNTATAVAVHHLRATWPDWPIVGVEPGLKPAVRATRNGRIGILATSGTLRSEKFQRLLHAHGHDVAVVLQPCPGLARAIEAGDLSSPELHALVTRYCAPLREKAVDTVVLGCTHYPFVAPLIRAALGPGVELIDTSDAVARRAAVLAADAGWSSAIDTRTPGPLPRLWTTGDAATLAPIARAWLDFEVEVVDDASHRSVLG